MIIEELRRDANGSKEVGRGPHAFDQFRFHHTTEPRVQQALETTVAANARCFQRGLAAVATATKTSIGKYAGNVARHCPTLVATPFPPLNPVHTG